MATLCNYSVYEGGHRVPAIAWWPGHIPAGSSSAEPAISIDVLPTLLALAGVAAPEDRPPDGVDLSPVLLQQDSLPARPLYWASLSNNGARSEAMRQGHWKLVVTHPGAKPGSFQNEHVELFHLEEDPGEQHNVAARHPDRTAAMQQQLKNWYADTQRDATSQPGGWQE